MLLQRPLLKESMSPNPFETPSSSVPSRPEIEKCKICWKGTDGTHFGVYSCRACAAFFRRSVAMKKKYVCRRGGDKCNLKIAGSGFCRKCRLTKCIETGMRIDYVQPFRDRPVNSVILRRPSPQTLHEPCTSNSSSLALPASSLLVDIISDSPVTERLKFLPIISRNYKKLCEIRKAIELRSYVPSIVKSPPSKYEGLRLCTAEELSKIYKLHLPAIMDLLNESFPEYAVMEEEHKWPLFQSFMAFMWRLDNGWRTLKTGVEPDKFGIINVVSETTYLDMEEVDTFISQVPNCYVKKEEIKKSLQDCMGRPRQRFMRLMNELNLSDEEYAALVGLALWDQTNSEYPSEELAKSIRLKIWDDLRLHYSQKNIKNYSVRLGELLTLYTTILFATARMRENVVLLELLDTFEQESIIYSFYKNCSLVG